jgi:hypothetical protein
MFSALMSSAGPGASSRPRPRWCEGLSAGRIALFFCLHRIFQSLTGDSAAIPIFQSLTGLPPNVHQHFRTLGILRGDFVHDRAVTRIVGDYLSAPT